MNKGKQYNDIPKVILDTSGNLIMSHAINEIIGLNEICTDTNIQWYGILQYDLYNPNQIRMMIFGKAINNVDRNAFIFHRCGNMFYLEVADFFNRLGDSYRDRPIEFIIEKDKSSPYYSAYRLIRCADKVKVEHPKRNNISKGKRNI